MSGCSKAQTCGACRVTPIFSTCPLILIGQLEIYFTTRFAESQTAPLLPTIELRAIQKALQECLKVSKIPNRKEVQND